MIKTVVAFVTIGMVVSVGYYFAVGDYDESTDDVIVNVTPKQENPVDVRTDKIMQSAKFQEEMRTLAKARAMFEMSLEKQAEALELSEQAKANYDKAQSLESQWHNGKVAE